MKAQSDEELTAVRLVALAHPFADLCTATQADLVLRAEEFEVAAGAFATQPG